MECTSTQSSSISSSSQIWWIQFLENFKRDQRCLQCQSSTSNSNMVTSPMKRVKTKRTKKEDLCNMKVESQTKETTNKLSQCLLKRMEVSLSEVTTTKCTTQVMASLKFSSSYHQLQILKNGRETTTA